MDEVVNELANEIAKILKANKEAMKLYYNATESFLSFEDWQKSVVMKANSIAMDKVDSTDC